VKKRQQLQHSANGNYTSLQRRDIESESMVAPYLRYRASGVRVMSIYFLSCCIVIVKDYLFSKSSEHVMNNVD